MIRLHSDAQSQDLLREGKLSVIFDLSGLRFIDSAGAGNAVMCFDKLKKSGGTQQRGRAGVPESAGPEELCARCS